MRHRKLHVHLEIGLVILFSIIFLWVGAGNILDHQLTHEYPHGYHHADAFMNLRYTQWVIDEGDFKYNPSYEADGMTDIAGFYTPRFFYLAAMYTLSSGMATHDSVIILLYLFALFASLAMYLLLHRINRKVAVLSLPCYLFFFLTFPSHWIFIQGEWTDLLGNLMIAFFAWSLFHFRVRWVPALSAVLLSAIIIDHVSHMPTVVFACGFYLLGLLLRDRKISKQIITTGVKLFLMGLAAFIMAIDYVVVFFIAILPYFQQGIGVQTHFFKFDFLVGGQYVVTLFDFKWAAIIIVIGMLYLAYKVISRKETQYALLFGLLLGMYGNLIGLTQRINFERYLMPLVFAPFFGAGLFFLYNIAMAFMKTRIRKILRIEYLAILMLVLVPAVAHSPFEPTITNTDKPHWDSLVWLSENTPEDAKVYYLYSDRYFHYYNGIYFNSKRVGVNVVWEDFLAKLQKAELTSEFMTHDFSYLIQGWGYPVRTGFLTVEFQEKPHEREFLADICEYDYIVFDIFSARHNAFGEYNKFIAGNLLQHAKFSIVFDQDGVVILKNEGSQAGCLEGGP
ncbi:MAG: hypothetical protein ABIC95_02995 [archaeon]